MWISGTPESVVIKAVAAIVAGPFSIWNVAQVVWIAVLTIQWARGRYGRDKSLRDFFS